MLMDIEANQQPKQERSTRNRWTASLDKVLADLVVKQIQLGNRQNNVFDRKTWNNIREDFNKQTDLNFNNNQLRKHLDVLRQRYNTLKSSRVQNEFVIEDSGCILGFDLWEDFGVSLVSFRNLVLGNVCVCFAENITGSCSWSQVQQPRNEPVKAKDCPIYEQLSTIFGDDSVDGKYAQSSHFEGLEESTANQTSGLFTSPTEATMASENLQTPNVVKPKTNSMERKRKREPDSKTPSRTSQIDQAALETMAGALSDMLTSLKSRMADSETTQDDRFSIANCIKALDEIENIEESVYFASLDLFEDPCLRETFMSLKAKKLRSTWLQVKCRKVPPSSVQPG